MKLTVVTDRTKGKPKTDVNRNTNKNGEKEREINSYKQWRIQAAGGQWEIDKVWRRSAGIESHCASHKATVNV